MKYDTVIIGGGLSGLACGISLEEKGIKCAIISLGQSAIHFSSGSFDLLNMLPDGTPVTSPSESFAELEKMKPEHPYSILGHENCIRLSETAPDFLSRAGLKVTGNNRANHYRMTPMGKMKSTWLSIENYLTSDKMGSLEWKNIAIFNIEGFLDFYPEFIKHEFAKKGIKCTCHELSLPEFQERRNNPSEMRSVNIARIFDKDENIETIAGEICRNISGCEAVLLPAVTGLSSHDALDKIRKKVPLPVYLVPTLPPSIPGIHAQQALQKRFRELGGDYYLGDTVVSGKLQDGRLLEVRTVNHGEVPFIAGNFVMSTGSFFSKGIIASPDRIYEPVLGIDTVYDKNRSEWYDKDFFAEHKYQSYGIRTDRELHAMKDGGIISNLYVTGAGLYGFNPIKEGCGAGVSILTALRTAEMISKNYEL